MTEETQTPRKSSIDDAAKKEWIDRINQRFSNQRSSIFDTGDILVEARQTLTDKDFREVVKATGLRSFSNADNYMRVAKHEFLRKPGIFEHLPPTVGALIDMACWDEEQLLKAIKEGFLHPLAKRRALNSWLMDEMMRPYTRTKPEPYTDVIVGHIIVDKGYYQKSSYREWDERFGAYLRNVNAAGHDFAFIASANPSSAHFVVRRQELEDRIKRRYRFHDEFDFEEEGMTAIFGEFREFQYQPLDWGKWVPRFLDAFIEGKAPYLGLTPDEIAFVRCQTEPRRPYPNPNSGCEAIGRFNSIDKFMADDDPAKQRSHDLMRFFVADDSANLEAQLKQVV